MTVAPGSSVAFPTASLAQRALALIVDWAASTLVSVAIVGVTTLTDGHTTIADLLPLIVYVLESALFTLFFGGSFGKLATRLRVVPSKGYGTLHNPLTLLARQAAIAFVIPPLVFREDGRGLHDLMAGTATVTLSTYRQLTTVGA
ncbi:RDD family protein [Nocardioides humilatus]|uniref:RDD family protein n=1 Tax=Nocardioides humilatus TaxID=2607660 RepID=A0A5B1L9U4_9ACTN|nr:RDD family protein [Nocardioides humilatus]KAA1416978.1 RDD family protein [Nocardioides humilatus]